MRSSITSSEVVEFLNQLLEADRPAVAALIANRVPCARRSSHCSGGGRAWRILCRDVRHY